MRSKQGEGRASGKWRLGHITERHNETSLHPVAGEMPNTDQTVCWSRRANGVAA